MIFLSYTVYICFIIVLIPVLLYHDPEHQFLNQTKQICHLACRDPCTPEDGSEIFQDTVVLCRVENLHKVSSFNIQI